MRVTQRMLKKSCAFFVNVDIDEVVYNWKIKQVEKFNMILRVLVN